MDGPDFGATVEAAIRALTAVSEMSSIDAVPSIRRGNDEAHAVGHDPGQAVQRGSRPSLANRRSTASASAGASLAGWHTPSL